LGGEIVRGPRGPGSRGGGVSNSTPAQWLSFHAHFLFWFSGILHFCRKMSAWPPRWAEPPLFAVPSWEWQEISRTREPKPACWCCARRRFLPVEQSLQGAGCWTSRRITWDDHHSKSWAGSAS